MNKFRKILTSAALAAVMTVSISGSAIAEEIESAIAAADHSIVIESTLYADTDEYYVLTADDGTVSTLLKDADGNVAVVLNGEETVLSETEFSELREAIGKRELLYGRSGVTKNGKVNIYFGVYTISRNPTGNVIQTYYGVFAKISDSDDITADLTIKSSFGSINALVPFSKSDNANYVYYEVYNADFINLQATVTSNTEEFGAFEENFAYNFT